MRRHRFPRPSPSRSQNTLLAACAAALLTGCGAACPLAVRVDLAPGDIVVGVPGDAEVIAASAERRWAVLWQAREDTDGNGVIHSYSGDHGARFGDRLETWIVLGGGPGVRVERFLGASDDDRWLAVVDGGEVELVEVTTGTRSVLGPSLGEWAWRHDAYEGGGPEASFTADGRVVWLATRNRVVLLDATDGERSEYAVPHGWVAWAYADATGSWIVADVLAQAPADPGDPSEIPHGETSGGPVPCGGLRRECFGPAMSHVVFRVGDPRAIEIETHDALARRWGIAAIVDDSLRIIRSADESRSVDTGCAAHLVHAGIEVPLVVYRCADSDASMFTIDGSPPQPVGTLDATSLPEIDRELLEIENFLSYPRDDLYVPEPAFWVGTGEYAWDPSGGTWRYWSWEHREGCIVPESMLTRGDRQLASARCIHGRSGWVYAIAEDGTALIRRDADERRICSSVHVDTRDSQLVWTRLDIEPVHVVERR